MYDLVGDRLQRDLRRAGRRHRPCSTSREPSCGSPTHRDEASASSTSRRSLSGSASTSSRRASRSSLTRPSRRSSSRNGISPAFSWAKQPKSSVWVPLVVGGRATGVISLQNVERERAFSEADLRLLTTLAGSLSVALENARLFEETRQRNAELALINDVQRGLAENLEMHAMYDLVGDRLQEIFDAQVVDIGVLDRDAGKLRFPYIDRARRPLPGRSGRHRRSGWLRHADAAAAPDQRAGHREDAGAAGRGTAAHGFGRTRDVGAVRPARRGRRGHRPDLAPEPRPRARVQRGGRSPAHDDRGKPERRARERPAVRGDPSAQRRARR